jgi:SAM-dependent methyltransferase
MRPRDLIVRSYFRTRFSPNAVRNTVWKGITDFLAPRLGLKSDARVLELGTGYGSWIRAVSAGERVALDLNPDLPEIFATQGITGVRTLVGSCTKIEGLPDGHFDLILASNLLEHLDLDEALLCVGEMRRLLKPGGQVCIIQPNFALKPRQYFDDFTHRTIFTHESLKDLFESMGFETVRMWKRFMPFSMKSSTARLAFLVPFYLRSPIKPMAGQMCLIARKTY